MGLIVLVGRVCRMIGLSVAVSLSACLGPSAVSDQAIAFDETNARAADAELLLNILRASRRNPTHYSSISLLRDNRSAAASGSVGGSFPFGRDALDVFGLDPNLTVMGSRSPSFDLATLSTKEDALGLYRPIEPNLFMMLWNQGWPREILTLVLVDHVSYNKAFERFCHLEGFPPGYVDGQLDISAYKTAKLNLIALFAKCMTSDLRVQESSDGDVLVKDVRMKADEAIKLLPGFVERGLKISETGSGSTRSYTVRQKGGSLRMYLGKTRRVGDAEIGSGPTTLNVSNPNDPKVVLSLRSFDGAVYFLGEVLRKQFVERSPVRVTVAGHQGYLFKADKGIAPSSSAIRVEFGGETYSVRRSLPDTDHTLTTLALLTQILALNRKDTEAPRTAAVEVVGSR